MAEEQSGKNPEWLSTYSILTAERILERFSIKLSSDELINTLRDPESHYYHLLTMPLKNIFNGLLINQVHTYQVHVQKLLVRYKLSQTGAADDGQLGTHSEEELKVKQKDVIQLGETFEGRKNEHCQLISDSQAWLIREAPKKENVALSSEMAAFGARAEEMMLILKNLRTEFRTLILDVTALLNVLPDYTIDAEEMAESQAALDFDASLGDVSNLEYLTDH